MSDRLSLLLDSASVADAIAANDLHIVAGITTNPTLMAKEGGSPLVQLETLLDVFPGPIFFQPTSTDPQLIKEELRTATSMAPHRVVVKVPARWDYIAIAAEFHTTASCALTAVYSPGQALLAEAAGFEWIIPYVNRAKRLAPDGDRLVSELASVLRSPARTTRILAASIKSADEAIQAVKDGAEAISAPLDVLRQLDAHPLTESAIEEFAQHDPDRAARPTRELGTTGR